MTLLTALFSGMLFAVGLGISGMTQPQKIIDFLNIAGDWDPSLMFVMGGGLLVYAVGLRLATRRPTPLFAPSFAIPTRRDLTPRLIVGSGLFGVGWALAGYCPGPALASTSVGTVKVLAFIGAMAVGMLVFRGVDVALTSRASVTAAAR